MAEGRESPDRSFLSKLSGDGKLSGSFRKWLSANWAAMAMLIFIFLLALFIRSYFAYEMSVDNGYIVSGGSDSYYWRRIIDYSADTGKHLYWDPLTAYPDGIRNPRPPLYSMSVVVPGVIAQDLFQSLDDSLGFMFVWSTAFWGALTVVPVYFLGKETFGRRAGLVAAFFLAVMPSHVQRSVLSNADHDSIILFLIVVTFYFLLRAVKTQVQKNWIENYRSPASIRKGLVDYLRSSRTSIIYSLMAGTAFAAVMMTWVGFGYAAVLILAYYMIQVLLNKFKRIDSLSVTMIVFITMGFGFLIAWPVYIEQSLIPVRFDVPVYLFVAAMFFGILFVLTRDLPWTITLPAIISIVVVGVAVVATVNPALGDAILSGQGYFVKSKLYSTIAEARAPRFSELALSFGMVTFFMSLIGLIWAIIKMPKHATAEYIFIVVWLTAAIFMAISAGRFMFNAAPAFAIASAWVLVIIVDRLDFNNVRKSFYGVSGSYWQVIKKSIKIRHVVGALFLGFLVVLPNVWYSMDAGIPSEEKSKYDSEIYSSLPSFMRPKGYEVGGTNWYLGAFGYSLPLPTYYFPAAWAWFVQQDADLAPVDRPAYVAWWDYGFEAIQEGQHPTVADNFQNGYQLTGNALMAQTEDDAIAIFAYRLIEAAYQHENLKAMVHEVFQKYNVSVERMDEVVQGQGQKIIDEVLSDSSVYGPMASDLSDVNARIVAGRVELVKVGTEVLPSLYKDICDVTGWEIRYFMADSRMMPLSGQSTGIFYAPAKLSDRRLVYGSTPVDFFTIKAVLDTGEEKDLDKVTSTDVVVDYTIEYKDMFYDSMFYRAMAGYSGADIGLSEGGVIGWRYSDSTVSSLSPMPGWNMSHFKLVYRTAYYNPYPIEEISLHKDAWTAVGLAEATELQKKINSGEIEGYIDQSASSFYTAGASFLKYYHGAYVNGTLTTQDGHPVAGVRVTLSDEYGIPHSTELTDDEGKYSLISPAGNITLSFTTGSATNQNLKGSTSIATVQFNVSEDQAMRGSVDADGDGVLDYEITKDVVMSGVTVTGDIFWDNDAEGNYSSSTDELMTNVTVYATDLSTGSDFILDAESGSISAVLPPGKYALSALINGRNFSVSDEFNVTYGESAEINLPVSPGECKGYLFNDDGTYAKDVELVLSDSLSNYTLKTVTPSDGSFIFSKLLGGVYMLTTAEDGRIVFDKEVAVTEGASAEINATIWPSTTLNYRVVANGSVAPYAAYTVSNPYNPAELVSGVTDEFGRFKVEVPEGIWTLYATYFTGEERFAGAILISTQDAEESAGTLSLGDAAEVSGHLRNPTNSSLASEFVCFQADNGARLYVMSSESGIIRTVLPVGDYRVTIYSVGTKGVYSGTSTVSKPSTNLQFKLESGALVSGAFYVKNDTYASSDEFSAAAFAPLTYVDSSGNVFSATADYSGVFKIVFPLNFGVELGTPKAGYAGWSEEKAFSSDATDVIVVATPDAREVSGYLTYEGVGLRNVQVSFLPQSVLSPAVYVMTGPGGYFNASIWPSQYSVVVDQFTGPSGGEKYQYNDILAVAPGALGITMDISPVKRIEVSGFLLGGGSKTELRMEGPEEIDLNFTTLNYTLYAMPGTYSVYASTTVSGSVYANMSSIDVSMSSRQHDLQLTRAYTVYGTVYIGSSHSTKQVSITTVAATGTVIHSKSSSSGSYSLRLPRGSYNISYLLEDTLKEGSQILYVEYFGEQLAYVTDGNIELDPVLALGMDNTTFSGRVLGPDGNPCSALIQMLANGAYGKNVTFMTEPSGYFSELVQPGDYTVYVSKEEDRRVALLKLSLSRNVPMSRDIQLMDGSYLSGIVTVAGSPAQLDMSLASGDANLYLNSDNSGSFKVLLPPMNYTLTASTTRMEGGLSVRYSGSVKATVAQDNVFVAFSLNRDTQRSVTASWNKSLTQSAAPGVEVVYVVDITNTGNLKDTYIVYYAGESSTGVTVTADAPGVSVDAGTNNKGSIEVKLNATSKATAGEVKVPIQIRSKTVSSVRSDVSLYLNVAVVRSVLIEDLNESKSVSSQVTYTKFNLNNTGNAQDKFMLNITNLEQLESLGWSAEIVEWDQGTPLPSLEMPAAHETPVGVKFTAIRANPDPSAVAVVIANSTHDPSVSAYSSIPVRLPDISVGRGDLNAERSDVKYEFNYSPVYLDLALLIALVSLVIGIFYLRRKKGLGGKKGRGGAKK